MDNLAEDYAATKGWCNFSSPAAEIMPLTKVDKAAYPAFQQPPLVRTDDVSPFYINGLSDSALTANIP
eukprot:gene31619-41052_t